MLLTALRRPLFRGVLCATARSPSALPILGATRAASNKRRKRKKAANLEGKAVEVNILKSDADPVIKADAEYPAWLHTLVDRPTLEELEEDIDRAGSVDDVDPKNVRLYMQRASKANIKDNNLAGKKESF